MSAKQFLDRVQATGMVDDNVIAKLRQQVEESAFEVPAKTVAETMIKKGYLTKPQAVKLLGQAGGGKAASSKAARSPAQPKPTPDEDLGLAPLGDEDKADVASAPSPPPAKAKPSDDLGLAPLDDDEIVEDDIDEQDDDVVAMEDAGSGGQAAGLQPVSDGGMEPVSGGLEPVDSGLEPVSGGLEPVSGGLEPVDSGLEPAGGGLEPMSGGLEAVEDTGGLEAVEDSGLTPTGGGVTPPPATSPSPMMGKKKQVRSNPWDSKLLYVGGGALVLLIILGVTLYFSLNRGTAAEVFQQAEESYRSQSYAQAINVYEKFLSKYPKDPNCSLARVKIGMAQMWQKTEGSRDKTSALDTVKEVLPTIQQEEAFPESDARAELASILPEIAEGFSEPAKQESDTEKAQGLVDLAEEAMKLVEEPTYIPTSIRRPIEPRIKKIREDIGIARRNINRNKRLVAAVAEIQNAAKSGDTPQAYKIRQDLLQEYPGLETNESLVESVLLITENERALVKVVNEPIAAATDDHPPVSKYPVALASRTGKGTSGNANHHVFCLARGAVYALKADTGELAWRRHVGYETLTPPMPLANQAGADVIVTDFRHNELLRLKGDSGELVWRLEVGERFSTPSLKGKQILLATASGRVLVVNSDTGESPRHVVIPQNLQVSPASGDRGQMYQVGDHSNLYVLDENTLECKEVFYLGHRTGTVVTTPVMALGHLFIADNSVPGHCDMHVLKVDSNGLSLEPVTTIRLDGHVVVRPLLVGARVVVSTDLGAIRIFEVNTANPEAPVQDAVEAMVASFKQPLASYPETDGRRMWVGNDRLTMYEIQSTQNRLIRKWIKNERDAFVAAPQVLGDSVYSVRRKQDSPSFTVSARNVADGELQWEADLAAPSAILDADREKRMIYAVSSQAELFDVTEDALLKTHRLDKPAVSVAGTARTVAFDEAIALDNGRWALASDLDRSQIILYNPKSATPSGRLLGKSVKGASEATVTARPVYGLGGLLIALDNGQVTLMDLDTGEATMAFQPYVEAGSKTQWRRPTVLNSSEFAVVDDSRKVYRVGIKDQPKPHLEPLAQAELEVDVTSPLAAAGDTIYGVVRGPSTDTVISLVAADLSAGTEWTLEGRVTWGPEPVGEAVMLATDKEGLICFEAGQTQRWISKLPYGPLAGLPLEDQGGYILASTSGMVWRVSGADGSEISKVDVGEPLGLGAAAFGTAQLLVSGADGTLFIIGMLPTE